MNPAVLIIALATAAGTARAGTTFELSAGNARAEAKSDGIWYQARFPHKLDLGSDYVSAGLRIDLSDRWALHAGAYRMGANRSDALAVTHDDLYDKRSPTGCPGECPPLARFMGRGNTWGLQALAEWHTAGRTQVGFLVGPIVYRTTWTMNIPDWFPTEPTGDGGWTRGGVHPLHLQSHSWNLSGAAGVRVTRGRHHAALIWYRDGSSADRGSYYPPIWQSHLTLSYGLAL